jgi:aerobic carbon-monoxide dehydrogenase medium subunit
MMKLRFAQPAHLIDLNRIPELRGIREEGNTWCIGAMTVENDLIDSAPCSGGAAAGGGREADRRPAGAQPRHDRRRHRARRPGQRPPGAALALDASFVLQGRAAAQVKADDFFLGTYMTRWKTTRSWRDPRAGLRAQGTGWAYEKLKRKTGDWATAGAAVVMRRDGGVVSHVRIGLTNVAPTAARHRRRADALLGQPLNACLLQAAALAAMAACDPAEDLRGDVEYKTAMAGQMVKRAIRAAAARCA